MCNIEKLESLPQRESRKSYLTRIYGNMWNLRRFDSWGGFENKVDPYSLSNRIIKNNIGKSFDMAFHYYCNSINKRYQYIFLDQFRKYRHYKPIFYIDENGIICKNEFSRNKPKSVIFKSFDYKEKNDTVFKKNKDTGKFEYQNNVILESGWWLEFESNKDIKYKTLLKQKRQLLRLDKKKCKTNNDKYYDWVLFKENYNKKHKDDKIDMVKLEAHGFDKNSFRGIEYHGGERKRNKQYGN